MNPFEMVAIIVIAAAIASVLRAKYASRGSVGSENPQAQAEAIRLREEVANLKERLKVLERIAVDKENALAKEIESLREQ